MNPTFSVLHATRGRPQKAIAAMRMWRERAFIPEAVEYIVAANSDDGDTLTAFAALGDETPQMVVADFKGSAPAWDAAAKASTGKLLIQAQDDLEPPEKWDHLLLAKLLEYDLAEESGPYVDWNTPTVIAVSDGYRKDALMTVAICNRARYEQQGEFLHAGYQSMFSDDEFSIRALADSSDGKCVLINARDLVFAHKNPYHTGAPQDDTLRRQNSEEAYALGRRLFYERNKDLLKRGIRTWK